MSEMIIPTENVLKKYRQYNEVGQNYTHTHR